jgi:hypothetical protein
MQVADGLSIGRVLSDSRKPYSGGQESPSVSQDSTTPTMALYRFLTEKKTSLGWREARKATLNA